VVRAAAYRPRTKVAPPGGEASHNRLVALTGVLVGHAPPTVVGPIDAAGAADALFEFLARYGYLDTETKDPVDYPCCPR
jgi:electron transfer flavoprotein beta subunit